MCTRTAILIVALAAVFLFVLACEPKENENGCKISNATCYCGYGCKTELIYRTRRQCLNALKGLGANNTDVTLRWRPSQLTSDRAVNACTRIPCSRGICTQTHLSPGYVCKCEGTGFYGQRCEKACPTVAVRGLIFPHECVVI